MVGRRPYGDISKDNSFKKMDSKWTRKTRERAGAGARIGNKRAPSPI